MKKTQNSNGALLVAVAGLLGMVLAMPTYAAFTITGGNTGDDNGDTVVTADPGECGKNSFNGADYGITITPGVESSVVCQPGLNFNAPVGITTVNCYEFSNPSVKDSYTVTVLDTQPPVVRTATSFAIHASDTSCDAVANYTIANQVLDGSATVDFLVENCPGYGCVTCPGPGTITCNPPPGTTFPFGSTTVTCIGADASGNKHTNSFPVIVTDHTHPEITVQDTQITSGGNPLPYMEFYLDAPGGFCGGGGSVTLQASALDPNCSGSRPVTCYTNEDLTGAAFVNGSAIPVGITRFWCTAVDESGNTALGSPLFVVTGGGSSGNCDPIAADPDECQVRFYGSKWSKYALFTGELTLSNGDLAPDFRDGSTGNCAAKGSIKVSVGCTGTPTVVYCKTNICFKVSQDCTSSNDNRERWSSYCGSMEKIFYEWEGQVKYIATRDPNVPCSAATGNVNIGKLTSVFIHTDETRFKYDFKYAAKPMTITVDGIVLLTVKANGSVNSAFPRWVCGKSVEVLYPGRLVPGNEICWYADGNPTDNGGLPENQIYCHTASANGTGTDTYINAGGSFEIKVPISGLNFCGPRCITVEFQVGVPGETPKVGCGSFTITQGTDYNNHHFRPKGLRWKSGGCANDDDNDDDDDDGHGDRDHGGWDGWDD